MWFGREWADSVPLSFFVYTRKKMTGEYGGVIINLSDLATLECGSL